jgi:hypothetical protein
VKGIDMSKIQTLPRPDVAVEPKVGIVGKARLRAASLVAALAATICGFLALGTGAANASTPDDPTGGAASDMLGSLTDWVQAYGVPLLFGLLLLGVTIAVAVKFARRGAKAVG